MQKDLELLRDALMDTATNIAVTYVNIPNACGSQDLNEAVINVSREVVRAVLYDLVKRIAHAETVREYKLKAMSPLEQAVREAVADEEGGVK